MGVGKERTRRPRVGIGLPVYNGERYLKEALDSILAQTYTDFQLILSDNCSTDATEEICRDYARKDPRIRYCRLDANLGAIKNFNHVFRLSDSDYFRWHCFDDLMAPTHLERSVETLDGNPEVVLCYPRMGLIGASGEHLSDYDNGLDLRSTSPSQRFRQCFRNLALCNVHYGLIRSDLLRKTSLFGTFIGSDEVFIGELTLYGQFREIPETLFYVRLHPESSSSIKTVTELTRFYDPARVDPICFFLWRHLYENMKVVWKSPIGRREKGKLYWFLGREMISNRENMLKEIVKNAREIWNSRFFQSVP